MATMAIRTQAGAAAGSIDLDDAWFGIEPNIPVMHQVVTAQLAARRSGTQSTKTRSEVSGGGAKPWRQKGTGRARQGSTRSPQWRGGGVALGPKPRSYAQRTPKKMIRLALRSALSDRAADGKVAIVDEWSFERPRTKDAVAALEALGIEGRVLVVLERDAVNAARSFRNLPQVHVLPAGQLNAYDVLVSDWVVFTRSTAPGADLADEAATQETPAEQPQAVALAVRPSGLSADREDDMTSDLPQREKQERAADAGSIDARERVKSVTDKDNPRFAAAKARTEREAELRARAKSAPPDRKGTDEATAEDAPERPSRARGFSFNETDEEEEGR